MSILRKPLSDVTIADLEQLISSGARETNELEFKGTLPFKPDKGNPAVADRWIEKGDRIGDYARDKLLAELVAFANADGGTVVLGLHETGDEPKRAERLEALPNCEDLARRIDDAAESVIEPRLPIIGYQALPVDESGAGYVVFRVGKSLAGPHRLKSTREFHVRRGERASTMDVREIKDLTLNLARTGDRIEDLFRERQHAARLVYERLPKATTADEEGPFTFRVTAIPTSPQSIAQITDRPQLWWCGTVFAVDVGGASIKIGHPVEYFMDQPIIRLRSFESSADTASVGVRRLLRSDGLIDFVLQHPRRPLASNRRAMGTSLSYRWAVTMIAGALSQVEWLRQCLALDGVSFALEVELIAQGALLLRWQDDWTSSHDLIDHADPLLLPRYEVGTVGDFDGLVTAVIDDLKNAAGRRRSEAIQVPWDRIVPSRPS